MNIKPNAIQAFVLIEEGHIEDPPAETVIRKGKTDKGWFYQLRAPSLEWLGDVTMDWCDFLPGGTVTMVVMKVLKAAPQKEAHWARGFAFTVPAVEAKRWAQDLVSDPRVGEAYLVTGTYDFVVFGDEVRADRFPPSALQLEL